MQKQIMLLKTSATQRSKNLPVCNHII